ncbi:MAG TPA: diacylglycerol kinase family protein [Ktedonobacteraceae bacterium]|nr:diacylglycerol kinase family protein [Ktedonobacteraceae bacterium]
MQKTRNVIVIHSPHSGRSAQLAEALAHLEATELHIAHVLPISELDKLPAQGSQWQEQGINIAIAAGGDGLIGGVITHIAESTLPLGILPLGTSNDIARTLHIPQTLQEAANVIARGAEQEVDIGVAQPAEQAIHTASKKQSGPVLDHVPSQRHGYFAHALTVGLNVEFSRLATNVATRQRYGRMTYPIAALEVLKNHDPLDVELHFEGLAIPATRGWQHRQLSQADIEHTPLYCRALQVAVINAPIFGGQWQLSLPQSSMEDRLLDIVVLHDFEIGNLSADISRLFNQQFSQKQQTQPAAPSATFQQKERETAFIHHPAELTGIPGIHHLQAQGVTITTHADPRDVTLDGEVRGQTPAHVRIAEQRLRVIVPE